MRGPGIACGGGERAHTSLRHVGHSTGLKRPSRTQGSGFTTVPCPFLSSDPVMPWICWRKGFCAPAFSIASAPLSPATLSSSDPAALSFSAAFLSFHSCSLLLSSDYHSYPSYSLCQCVVFHPQPLLPQPLPLVMLRTQSPAHVAPFVSVSG